MTRSAATRRSRWLLLPRPVACRVSLWLTGEASWFATPGGAVDLDLPYATPAAELLTAVLSGGTVTLCSQCAARRMITADDVVDGVRIAGATTFLAEVMAEGAQALVY